MNLWIQFLLLTVVSSPVVSLEQPMIPALGRIFYDIGSLYDARTGNFLPREIQLVSQETLKNPQLVTTQNWNFPWSYHPGNSTTISNYQSWMNQRRVNISPTSRRTTMFFGHFGSDFLGGLAIRALLGMLDFPGNGSAGFAHERWTEDEMKNINSDFILHTHIIETTRDTFKLPAKNKTKSKSYSKIRYSFLRPPPPTSSLSEKEEENLRKSPDFLRMKQEILLNILKFQEKFPKVLKRATHVVVEVYRGDRLTTRFNRPLIFEGREQRSTVFSMYHPVELNQSMIFSSQLFSDTLVRVGNSNSNLNQNQNYSSSSLNSVEWRDISAAFLQHSNPILEGPRSGGVPLYFELMPINEFINSLGLEFPASSPIKFRSFKRDPMAKFKYNNLLMDLNGAWGILNKFYRLEANIQKCVEIHQHENKFKGSEKEKDGKIVTRVQKLKTLRNRFLSKFLQYKKDVKHLLKRTSNGSKRARQVWKFHYSDSTGLHKRFQRELRKVQEGFYKLVYSRKPISSEIFDMELENPSILNFACDDILKVE